jgi:hypothetical protein
MALVSVFIGQVGVLVDELGVSELGPGPGLFVGEAIGNGSRVAVEVEIGVAEDDDAGSIGVSEHGPELCLEEPIGNGSSVAVEVGI